MANPPGDWEGWRIILVAQKADWLLLWEVFDIAMASESVEGDPELSRAINSLGRRIFGDAWDIDWEDDPETVRKYVMALMRDNGQAPPA